MTDDFYLIAITALLPLTAVMLVLQVNPYQALVMRGILGAIAALIYALFGAADVALTEALVGTMLSITLYAVAVRSSMEMRLGWVQPTALLPIPEPPSSTDIDSSVDDEGRDNNDAETSSALASAGLNKAFVTALRQSLKPHHLRLELLAYPSREALQIALNTKRIHGAVFSLTTPDESTTPLAEQVDVYRLQTRVKRLHGILSDYLPPHFAYVDYLDVTQSTTVPSSTPSSAQPSLSHSAQESP